MNADLQKPFLSERKGKVIPCRWIENRKGAGTSDGESGARNLEAESIRSRAENTEGCIKLTTVTEIRWSSARDTVITESVYLVLNSFLDWKPAEKLKQRCDVVSFMFFSAWDEQHSSVCDAGYKQRKQASQKGENCCRHYFDSRCSNRSGRLLLLRTNTNRYKASFLPFSFLMKIIPVINWVCACIKTSVSNGGLGMCQFKWFLFESFYVLVWHRESIIPGNFRFAITKY